MKKKGWKEIPIGGLIDKAGSATEYKTGDWRTFKPVVNKEKCIKQGKSEKPKIQEEVL